MKTLRLAPFHRAMCLFGLLLATLLAWPAHAQDTANAADPPTRVGRLAEVQGEVWVFDNDEGEWIEAVRNRPVAAGDRLSSSRSGRAEVRIGSTTVRIDANTELEVTALDDDRVTVRLHSGDVATRLRSREAAQEFELLTPEGAFRPDRAGNYRFSRDDDLTEATAFAGQLQVRATDAAVTVKAGQRYRFWQDNGTQFEDAAPRRDAFDDWVASRDEREDRSASARYVSPEMTGVEDLDRYGRWENDAEYGALWIPSSVSPGWAPYRVGRWVWISPWGWTWVDDAPWGFAPFHYGRWVSRGNVWCWSPGRYVARPVYAPALVAWIGGGAGSVSVHAGRRVPPTVGWFPLGPREVYVPGHRFTPHYMRGVNGNHVPNGFNFRPFIRNPRAAVEQGHYRYRGVPNAVTIVPRQVVERRQPVGPAIIGMNGRPLPGALRPRPDAPVMPGGRPPSVQRPAAPQIAIPAAPGVPGERFGAPRYGRGDRQNPREPDYRRRDSAPPVVSNPVPQPGLGSRDDADRVRPGVRPGFPNDPGRPSPMPSARDERWRQLRPAAPKPEPHQPAPRIDSRPAVPAPTPAPDAHRPGGFNHMRPHPQQQQPVQPQQPAPQVHRPPQPAPTPPAQAPQVQQQQPRMHAMPMPHAPQVQSPQVQAPRPVQMPPPQVQQPRPQPQPQAQPAPPRAPGGGEPRRDRDEGPRHRRTD